MGIVIKSKSKAMQSKLWGIIKNEETDVMQHVLSLISMAFGHFFHNNLRTVNFDTSENENMKMTNTDHYS